MDIIVFEQLIKNYYLRMVNWIKNKLLLVERNKKSQKMKKEILKMNK